MTLPSDRIPSFDLGHAFANAAGLVQLQQNVRAAQRQREIDDALKAGDLDRWAQLDPTGAAKYQQTLREGQKAKLDMAKTQQGMLNDRAKRTQEEAQLMANTLAQNPRMAGYFKQRFALLGDQIDPINVPGADQANTVLEPGQVGAEALPARGEVRTAQTMAGVDPMAKLDPNIREYLQVHPNDSLETAGFGDRYDAWNRSNKKSGASNTSVTVDAAGNQGLTTAGRTEAQGKVASNRLAMESLNDIDAAIRPEFFTYEGQMKRKYLHVKAKAGAKLSEDDQNYLADFRDASEGIGGMFNIVRKEVTGAGAALAELEKMKDTAINMDMDYPSFIASYNRAKRITQRTLAFNQKMLDEGVPVADREARMNAEAVKIVAEEREGRRRRKGQAADATVPDGGRSTYRTTGTDTLMNDLLKGGR